MDQMLFDITDVPDAQDGDVITLIGSEQKRPGTHSKNSSAPGKEGKTLYLATWAQMLNTITYELACRLRARLPRIYTRHMAVDGKSARLSSTSKSS
jgi:alanine racemase